MQAGIRLLKGTMRRSKGFIAADSPVRRAVERAVVRYAWLPSVAMLFAASLWFVGLPWWVFWLLAAVVVLAGGFALWFLWDERHTQRLLRGEG